MKENETRTAEAQRREVIIDGVRYVPAEELECAQVETDGARRRVTILLRALSEWRGRALKAEAVKPAAEPLQIVWTAPAGYEFTGEYRSGALPEWILLSDGTALYAPQGHSEPRWILRKLPTIESVYGKPLEQLKAPEGWEFTGEFRVPSEGELFLSSLDHTPCAMGPRPTPSEPRLILRRIEQPTIESVYGAPRASLQPPAGWTLGEFREPKFGERFLSRKRLLPTRYDGGTWTGGPRLILEPVKADAPKRRRWIFEETGQRCYPTDADWFARGGAIHGPTGFQFADSGSLPTLLRLVERPE